jgi:hypothetical protein
MQHMKIMLQHKKVMYLVAYFQKRIGNVYGILPMIQGAAKIYANEKVAITHATSTNATVGLATSNSMRQQGHTAFAINFRTGATNMLRPEAAQLHKLCTDIAFFLNVGEESPIWTHTIPADEERANYPSQDIQQASNPEIHLNVRVGSYGQEKGRIAVSGNFHIRQGFREVHDVTNGNISVPNVSFYDPRDYNERQKSLPSISCAPTKTAEQIAKDIKRRLLPEYLPLITRAIEKRDASEKYYEDSRNNLQQLAAIVGYEHRINKNESTAKHVSGYSSDGAYCDISTNDNGITDIKINNLTMDQAKRVLAIVAEKRTEQA